MESMTVPRLTVPISDGQIDKAAEQYKAMLVRQRAQLDSPVIQQILGQRDFAEEQVGVLWGRIALIQDMIVRRACIDPSRHPLAALKATGKRIYDGNRQIMENMPRGEKGEIDVYFFNLRNAGRNPTFNAILNGYKRRGLIPAGPYLAAAVNEKDSDFAGKYPNATFWRDPLSRSWCSISFVGTRMDHDHAINISNITTAWDWRWYFAGILRQSK